MKLSFPFLRSAFARVPYAKESGRLSARANRLNYSIFILICLGILAMLLALVVSASKRSSSGAGVSPVKTNERAALATGKDLKPLAVNVTATLTDDILTSAKKNPGDTITYRAVI